MRFMALQNYFGQVFSYASKKQNTPFFETNKNSGVILYENRSSTPKNIVLLAKMGLNEGIKGPKYEVYAL